MKAQFKHFTRRLVAIPTTLQAQDSYHLNVDKLRETIKEQGLSVRSLAPFSTSGSDARSSRLSSRQTLGTQRDR